MNRSIPTPEMTPGGAKYAGYVGIPVPDHTHQQRAGGNFQERLARLPDRPSPEQFTRCQKLLQRGLPANRNDSGRVDCTFSDGSRVSGDTIGVSLPPTLANKWRGQLGVMYPSVVSRMPATEYLSRVDALLTQLEEALRGQGNLQAVFVASMQWRSGEENDASERISGAVSAAGSRGIPWIGFTQRASGKISALNAAVRLTAPCKFKAWLWLDDDVKVDAQTLRTILNRFEACPWLGAVGAVCRPKLPALRAPHLVYSIKRITQNSQYPQACCMVVASEAIPSGVPKPFTADDGYVLARLIDVVGRDPFKHLEVVDGTSCEFAVRPTTSALYRIHRRALYNHILIIASVDRKIARVYLWRILFHGLIPRMDSRTPPVTALLRGALKWAHLAWFVAAAAWIICRGCIGRPVETIRWE